MCSQGGGGIGLKNPKDWNKAQLLYLLCLIVSKQKSLWCKWVNTVALKTHHFRIMDVPNDCPWIWRRILNLWGLASQFLTYHDGNGKDTSLWFDPWWRNSCLAKSIFDISISQSGLSHNCCVNSIIDNDKWVLPTPSTRHHHISPTLQFWLDNFEYPHISANIKDDILWHKLQVRKLKSRHIWDY